MAHYYSSVWIHHILLIHSSLKGCLSCFYFLAIVRMILWTFMYRFLCRHMFLFVLCIYLWEALLGAWYLCVCPLRNRQTVLHSGYTILHAHQQCIRAPVVHILTDTCYYLLSLLYTTVHRGIHTASMQQGVGVEIWGQPGIVLFKISPLCAPAVWIHNNFILSFLCPLLCCFIPWKYFSIKIRNVLELRKSTIRTIS